MPNPAERAALIEAVRDTARVEILPRFRNLDAAEVMTKGRSDDLVTVADRAAEAMLTRAAGRILPGTAVVGEEAVAEDASILSRIADAERCVIIDPIDGTGNFVAGLATFGVILAVVERGQTVFGLLYDPAMDDWIAGAPGQGAWYGRPGAADRPLQCRRCPSPADAAGFVSPRMYPSTKRGGLFEAFSGFGYARGIGCSCHDYRTIAFGQADFAASPMMNPWDHAAGVLIVTEAGGAARVAFEAEYSPYLTEGPLAVVGDPDLLAPVEAALQAAPPTRSDR
ncbi:MAG: inositol monophosphatase [Pseudomonadota bacterium]